MRDQSQSNAPERPKKTTSRKQIYCVFFMACFVVVFSFLTADSQALLLLFMHFFQFGAKRLILGLKFLFHSLSGQRRASWAPVQQNIITIEQNQTSHVQLYTLHCDYVVHGSVIVYFVSVVLSCFYLDPPCV